MRHGNLVRSIRLAAVTVLLVCAAAWAGAKNPPALRYNFQAGQQYAYEVTIRADLEDVEQIREGVLTYNVLSATDQQIQLKQSGRLATQTKRRPGRVILPGRPPLPFGPPMMGGFPMGGPRFGPAGPVGTTIDRQGKVIVSQELTPLPFLLGDAELLVIEELPTSVKLTWDKQRDVRVEEKQSAGPFGPPRGQTTSERGAKERIDYALVDRGPDLFRISKKYQLRTGAEAGGPGRFDMTGAGELQFDPKEGVFKSGSMKYTIRINEPNLRKEVCAVLAEIGGQESLKALQAAAEGATGLDRMDVNRAIAAVEKRVEAGDANPPPKPAKVAAAPPAKPREPEYRTWRDATGTYEVEAVLVANQDQKVTLKRKDGKTVQVPISKLSKEDRDYLEKQAAKPVNPFE